MSESLSYESGIEEVALNKDESFRTIEFVETLRHTIEKLQISAEKVVHIGGTGLFYLIANKYGIGIAKNYFRGTHDLDIMFLNPSDYKNFLSFLGNNPNKFLDSVEPENYSHLESKSKIGMKLKRGNFDFFPKKDGSFKNIYEPDNFEIDVYYPDRNGGFVKFNKWLIGIDGKFILDEPQTFSPDGKAKVSTPSLVDSFILKTDIISFSESGLRSKDKVDLLLIISMMEEKDIIRAVDFMTKSADSHKKLDELFNVLDSYEVIVKKFQVGLGRQLPESMINTQNISKIKMLISRYRLNALVKSSKFF
jgi:hypothetical protein